MAQHGLTILIVDDDEGHVELVKRHLRRAGVDQTIESLNNGRDALDYVFARGAHAARSRDLSLVILLDINMPGGVDGIEVLRQVKAQPETRRIPIVMFTTADDPREIDRCYDLGCNVYVTKPVDPSAFRSTVQGLGSLLSVARIPSDAAPA
jgi:CheY-like chemotaxis protein